MAYEIIRGENQIGGTITKIFTEHTSVFVDFGAQLPGNEKESTDGEMVALINENSPDAVIFSHIHGDHIGLLAHIPDSVKAIYIGEVGYKLMKNIRDTLIKFEKDPEKLEKLQKEKAILEDRSRIRFLVDGTTVSVGDIVFKPYNVDHSVCDAYMFKFYVDGKVILHTGDFRNHGRFGENFLDKLSNEIANEPIDILITEGTMMSRPGEEVRTEQQLEDEATDLLMRYPYAFLICSSTNLESLASFQQAMIRSGRNGDFRKKEERCPPFIANSYVMAQFEVFREAYGKDNPKYAFHRCYTIRNSLEGIIDTNTNEKQIDRMKTDGFLMMVGTSKHYLEMMEKFEDCNPKPIIIYSMWEGYLEQDEVYSKKEYIDLKNKYGDKRFVCLHTSGHATAELLAQVIDKVKPREEIRPVHTENAKAFMELEIEQQYKERIKI